MEDERALATVGRAYIVRRAAELNFMRLNVYNSSKDERAESEETFREACDILQAAVLEAMLTERSMFQSGEQPRQEAAEASPAK